MNDEWVTMMTGLWIPSLAMNRGMFPEYHTHKDTPDRIEGAALLEGWDVVRGLILNYDEKVRHFSGRDRGCISLSQRGYTSSKNTSDFMPVPLFRGPVCLSRYGLWVDWREQPELNAAMDLIMGCMDGCNSADQIADFVGVERTVVVDFIESLIRSGLVEKKILTETGGRK